MQPLSLTNVIAHRGANRFAPENTVPAFRLAKQQGASWVEFDVQLSRDNIPVIIHDETLERTTNGHGLVRDFTFAQLRALMVQQYGITTHIPSLAETLNLLTTVGLHANIEIKSVCTPNAALDLLTDEPLDLMRNRNNAALTCNELKHYLKGVMPTQAGIHRTKSQFLISSFCMAALHRARQVLPNIPIGMLLYFKNWEHEWPRKKIAIQQHFKRLDAYSLHINQEVLTVERACELQKICPRILTYTVNDVARSRQLFSFDIHSIFTDNVLIFE